MGGIISAEYPRLNMPQLLALEWDAREARVAVGRTRGREVVVEHAFAVDLLPRDGAQDVADVNVGERIASALAARSIGRCDTLVAVGRTNIELRRLSIPPAPPDELPDMVRFQALRQFTGIGDDWPLDFVPLESSEPDTLNVLAAAISPEIVEQIRSTCHGAELVPRHLVLRPFAAASLLRRRRERALAPCHLMVDLLAEEADLTVLVDQQVALVRTVRVPPADASGTSTRVLLGEIRRTIAAAHNQLRDRRIERVILFGAGEEQEAIKSQIEQELGQEVETYDPFSGVHLTSELTSSRPEYPGRFAPLFGMLVDEAAGDPHEIDFLHPRRKAAPVSQSRKYAVIGAAAAAVVFAIVFAFWMSLSSLDSEIADLTQRANGMKDQVTKATKKKADAKSVADFLQSDISWIDEMYRLARDLPSSEDIILTQVTLTTRAPSGGQIILDGFAREHEQIRNVEDSLRNDGRQVVSTGGQYDERRSDYHWRFKETVVIEPTDQAKAAPAAKEAPKAPASKPEAKKS
jgi:Tfp pilus assembly PilM family ATPase